VRIGATEPVAGSGTEGGGGGEAEAAVARRPVMARRPAGRRPQRRRRRRRRLRSSHVVGHVVLDGVAGDIWRTAAQRVSGATPGERHRHHIDSFATRHGIIQSIFSSLKYTHAEE